MLPGMTGLSAIEGIKRRTKAPIIAITGYARAEFEKVATSHGAQAFMPKPIDFEKLASLISEFDGKPAPGAG